MLRTRRLVVLPLLVMALAVTATALPAEAAAKRPSISLKASPSVVALQSKTTLTGKVSGSSAGSKVTLQRRSGGGWKSVKSTKVKRDKTYRFATTVKDARTSYRVKVVKNSRLKTATSKTVKVRGTTAEDAARHIILDQTNAFRAKNGLRPLALMPELNAVAQGWSVQMATTSDFKHNPNFVASYPSGWSAAGENIAGGAAPHQVVTQWIYSEGHRKNLLGDWNYIGIGYATGGEYGSYYTQNFGKYPGR